MVAPDLPEIPQSLKSIQHYLKIASTHDQRDPVISYWCRLYALQTGLKLSTKTPKETNFLLKLMDWLETTKKELHDNEAITNDVAAQAHLENWALKLFLYADKNDRNANFGKSVIQSFFTAGLLYDVLTVFGELSDEATQNRKYAKWKAAYIHNCLKNNETPIPGPIEEDNENADSSKNIEGTGEELREEETLPSDDLADTNRINAEPSDKDKGNIAQWSSGSQEGNMITKTEDGLELSVEQIGKAQKFIKWAGSALNYDDVPTAVSNLRKALHLLTTGQEPV
ncbi:vacuolar protein sorting-associated protein VTA1 homolog isoform X2 [Ceratina calcarata]|uniref:Vacuolar protein sorting-associated protein VTA1 homolog isoform X2 n=1 Tax=Ceratina calcarata TaxID=156304 RepID=A0AAJ7J826_9HYME|nr:vacuolar protein sorting-associated protein VTA1 homolog isoform X2 [Ceratina calcarata]